MPVTLGKLELLDGSTCELRDLCARGPLALVFLRHLGCVFCRRMLAQLARRPHWNVALVVLASRSDARAYFERHPTVFPVIVDQEARHYATLGLRRGGMGAVASVRVFGQGFAALAEGHRMGKTTGDPFQLGGAFVISEEQEIVWQHRSMDASDTPSIEAIGRALEGAVVARQDHERLDRH